MLKRLACFISFLLVASQAHADKLVLLSEQYEPFNYIEAGEFKGTSVDQISHLMKAAGIDYKIEFMTWARALSLAETSPGYCVFTTAHDESREGRFKWVEPLFVGRTILIRKDTSDVRADTISEARGYIVGTQRADFTHTWLMKNNFKRIELAADMEQSYQKLLLGRIDLMPINEEYFLKLKRQGANIAKVLLIAERNYGIACNKETDDRTIKSMQDALDALIEDGTQARLISEYGLSGE